jgi:hypothetical protein
MKTSAALLILFCASFAWAQDDDKETRMGISGNYRLASGGRVAPLNRLRTCFSISSSPALRSRWDRL